MTNEKKWKIAAVCLGAATLHLGYKLIQKQVQNSNLLEITRNLNRELEETESKLEEAKSIRTLCNELQSSNVRLAAALGRKSIELGGKKGE